jgi:hypothetical protein
VISYSTNWMGVANMQWYEERGLTKTVTHDVQEGSVLVDKGRYKVGDTFERQEVIEDYSTGRIDIRNVPGDDYWNGWHEYSLAPMRTEDWNHFGDWLDDFETEELWEFDDIIAKYEQDSGRKIRWADDVWYQCYECGLVTDLRETKEHIHKMDCTRKWDE